MTRSAPVSAGAPLGEVFELCEEHVFGIASTEELLNPYLGVDAEADAPQADGLRRDNLRRYLEDFERPPGVMILAEAPGPWGCRFSGVPITSEAQLVDPDFPIDGEVTSRDGVPHAEYSAGIFWRVMRPFYPAFLVWNAVPFHPRRIGQPTSIRTPRVSELRRFAPVTAAVVELLGPVELVALGRRAEAQMGMLGLECRYVRHPSQGGARAFERGMLEVFGSTRR